MNKRKRLRLVAPAYAVILVGGVSSDVYGAYAISFNDITNLVITGEPNEFNVISSTPLSGANANLNGSTCNTGGITFTDAPVCNAPGSVPLRVENAFNSLGVVSTDYCNADAQIPFRQTEGDAFTQALSIAEGNVALDGSSGDSDAQDTSTTSFSIQVGVPTQVRIAFDADPFMSALLEAQDGPGSAAVAEIGTTASIIDNTTGSPTFGQIIFEWTPDGALNSGISGGLEIADGADLNRTIQTAIPGSTAEFDPNANGTPNGTPSAHLHYEALTDELPAGNYTISLAMETDIGVIRIAGEEAPLACRLTGGGVSIDDTTGAPEWDGATLVDGEDQVANGANGTNRYQFGGQAGAPTAEQPQPSGEWQHHQQSGPSGSFSFHAGTASAPAGTEIVEIRCSDPGGCSPSGNPPSPNKQLDFDCVGTFKNIGAGSNRPDFTRFGVKQNDVNVTAEGHGNQSFDGTFHYCEVNVDDNGEGPDPAEGDDIACPPDGFGEKSADPDGATEFSNCDCPDFYRITIYNGVDAADVAFLPDGSIDPASLNTTDIIYEAEGYLGLGGNGLQMHSPIK